MTSRDYATAAIGLGLITAVLIATGGGPAVAQGALKPLQALIVNSSNEPVPVVLTGATSVDGVVTVRSLDEPGRSPYQEQINFILCQQSSNAFSEVPAGKRLVITHVSASLTVPLDGGISMLRLSVDEFKVGQFLTAHLFPNNTLQQYYAVNEDVLAYAEAGDTPAFSYSGRCGGGAAVTLSGYFIDLD
jgi:hypothetical protein